MAEMSVEQELWRIFTFYCLHADPTIPDQLKIPSFIRLAKDCQIISGKLKGAVIELEVARVVRCIITLSSLLSVLLNSMKARVKRKQDGDDYSTSTSLSFSGFLSILGILSDKVFSSINISL